LSISQYIADSVVDSAVGLILVESGNTRNVMTVSFFSEVAHHRTALWVAVSGRTYTHSLIKASGRFTLAVLNQKQKAVALQCGAVSGREQDKCAALDLYKSPGGFLFLRGALASTGCAVRQQLELGDHTLFVGDIIESELDSRKAHLRQLLLSDL
jgi:flavin reductase (DIM6/NTAB) family NADH-FMN oxidoreductase RutF